LFEEFTDRINELIPGGGVKTADELRKFWARYRKKRNFYYVENTDPDDEEKPVFEETPEEEKKRKDNEIRKMKETVRKFKRIFWNTGRADQPN